MKIFFDTEFIEDGKTIDLVSIGMVKEDGSTYYAVSNEYDEIKASTWVKENVLINVNRNNGVSRKTIANDIIGFVGEKPKFWAYYADYDWVVLCQLYGTMMDLPKGWPMFCRDLKQYWEQINPTMLKMEQVGEHHALNDAIWVKNFYERLGNQ